VLKGYLGGISRIGGGWTDGLIKESGTADGLDADLDNAAFVIENSGVKIDVVDFADSGDESLRENASGGTEGG
jgi:hypothetical protein